MSSSRSSGTFEVYPWAAAIAAFVMILAAGYLLYMYGRIVFGELSAFFDGLGDHLTDMTATEVLTLVPLGALVVAFGIQPGLLLDLVNGTVDRDARGGRVGCADPRRARGRDRRGRARRRPRDRPDRLGPVARRRRHRRAPAATPVVAEGGAAH